MSDRTIRVSELDPNFKFEVAAHGSAREINACFACGTCSAGCPVHEVYPEYNPRKIVRMIKLGMREEVLKSPYIWLCSTCYTCQERCPQDVGLTEVMNAIKNIAVKEGYTHPSYTTQIDLIDQFGRLYEIDDFDNKKRGKLNLPAIPTKCEEIGRIFRAVGLKKKE